MKNLPFNVKCNWLAVFQIVMLLLFGLSTTTTAQSVNFVHNGNNRTCTVHLPAGFNPLTYPLVFNLHGYGSSAMQQQLYSLMDNVADTAKFIVAYPNAESGVWDTEFSGSAIDDVGYFNRLLDSLIARFPVDPERVYVTGMSMGGFMSYRLACEMGTRIKAIASVAGPTVDSLLMFCSSAPVIPIMHIHGTSDSTVPYNGTTLYNHVDTTIQHMIDRNGCNPSPTVTNLPNINTADNCTITSYCYSCNDSNEVLFYKIFGGGHTWPGGLIPIPPFGNTNYDIHGSSHIWNFFNRHKPEPTTQVRDLAANAPLRIFPNPASDNLHIQLPADVHTASLDLEVMDISGRILQRVQQPYSNQVVLNIQGLEEGMYFIRVLLPQGQTYQSVFSVNRSGGF